MENKIILEIPNKTEEYTDSVDFITIQGTQNTVRIKTESIEKFKALTGLNIKIFGNNNTVNLDKIIYPKGAAGALPGLELDIGLPADDTLIPGTPRDANNCYVEIGENTIICGATLLLVNNDTSIKIGKNCMISWGIDIWCTDAHTVTDLEGNPINFSKSIEIGDHVWIGRDVKIGKNTKISNDSIIGWGSIVTKKFEDTNVVIAGNPAKIVKRNINWDFRDLYNYELYRKSQNK